MSPRCRAALLLLSLALGAGSSAHAERADRDKPINIESDRMTADDTKKVAVFEGRVVMTQGTFILRADKLVVRQDKEGMQAATATGKPATFRTKRDGVDEWVDGESDRIEYDGRQERVELFDRARLIRDKDEVRGNYISYDTKSEFFQVLAAKGAIAAAAPSREGARVSATFQPKPKPATPGAPAAPVPPPLELRTEPALGAPGTESR
jgi:lipopolysaccharide export system protein LptA